MKGAGVLCCLVIVATAAEAGVNSWTSHGPWGAPVQVLEVAPQNRDVVYAGTEAGLFRSGDRGHTWVALYTGIPAFISRIGLDPRDANVIYISTFDGFRRSTDSGVTWQLLRQDQFDALHVDAQSTVWAVFGDGAFKSPDRGDTWERAGDVGGGFPFSVSDFASLEGAVYAVSSFVLTRTTDGGATWQVLSTFEREVSDLAISPADPTRIYTAGSGGVFRSDDEGRHWINLRTLAEGELLGSIAVDALDADHVVAAVSSGIVESLNGGETWHELGLNPKFEFFRIVLAGESPPDVLAGTRTAGVLRHQQGLLWTPSNEGIVGGDTIVVDKIGSHLYVGMKGNGVHLSTDGGRSWAALALGETPTSLTIDGTDPSVVYLGTQYGGLLRSADAGQSFQPTGLAGEVVESIAAWAGVVLATTEHGLFRSSDHGATWMRVEPTAGFSAAGPVVFDPISPNVAYAAHPLARTLDAGITWTLTNLAGATSLVVIPGTPSKVVLAVAGDLYRAASGSTSFVRIGANLPPASRIVALDYSASDRRLYAIATPLSGFEMSEIYVSADEGDSWQRYAVQPQRGRINTIEAEGPEIWIGTWHGLFELTEGHARRRRAVRK